MRTRKSESAPFRKPARNTALDVSGGGPPETSVWMISLTPPPPFRVISVPFTFMITTAGPVMGAGSPGDGDPKGSSFSLLQAPRAYAPATNQPNHG